MHPFWAFARVSASCILLFLAQTGPASAGYDYEPPTDYCSTVTTLTATYTSVTIIYVTSTTTTLIMPGYYKPRGYVVPGCNTTTPDYPVPPTDYPVPSTLPPYTPIPAPCPTVTETISTTLTYYLNVWTTVTEFYSKPSAGPTYYANTTSSSYEIEPPTTTEPEVPEGTETPVTPSETEPPPEEITGAAMKMGNLEGGRIAAGLAGLIVAFL